MALPASLHTAPFGTPDSPRLTQPAGRIVELESIRGLAAVLVMMFHLPKWAGMMDIGLVNNGERMVDLFFVLSGFVIYRAYADEIQSFRDLAKFQFLRLGRLYPVHLLFLLAFTLIESTKYGVERFGLASLATPAFSEYGAAAFGQHVFLLQAVIPGNDMLSFNRPAWSISAEFYTYVIFALAVWLFRRQNALVFVVLTLIPSFMLLRNETYGLEGLCRCLAGFSMGCLTAITLQKVSGAPPRCTSFALLLSMLICLQLQLPTEGGVLFCALSSLLIASIVRTRRGLLSEVLRTRPLLWLGKISYSVYMSHYLIIWVVIRILKLLFPRPALLDAHDATVLDLTPAEAALGVLLVVSLTLLTSHLINKHFETPFRERSRRLIFGLTLDQRPLAK